MKKAIAIIVLGLLWCNIGFAETKDSVNYYKKQNYKIIKYISVEGGYIQRITLEKRGHVVICSLTFKDKYSYIKTYCYEP